MYGKQQATVIKLDLGKVYDDVTELVPVITIRLTCNV